MLVNVDAITITIPTSDTVVAGTVKRYYEGIEFGNVVLKNPALEGTGTATLTMVDSLLGTICSVAADESTTKLGTPNFKYYTGTLSFIATADGTQSADAVIEVNNYYRAKHG
jgi:hypothetical protein